MKMLLTTILGLILAASVLAANPAGGHDGKYADSRIATGVDDLDVTHYINANNILMFVTNQGGYGRDLAGVFGYDAGTFFPYTTVDDIISGAQATSPLYAAGLWMGGRVSGAVRVAISEYASEYWPGPMSAGTFISNADVDPVHRVYKLYADSGASNPNQDYIDWPDEYGAPTTAEGTPLILGDQTMWAVCNDANPALHTLTAGSTDPLGIEAQAMMWANDDFGYSNVIHVMYKLYNKGGNTITDFYVAVWMDPDIGFGSDDLVGCDTLNSMFFAFNADNDDGSYGINPPAMGVKMVYGPVVPATDSTARFFDHYVGNHRNLPMSTFIKYVGGADPSSATQTYNLMQGLNADGSPLTNGTTFMVPGDPVAGTGDIDVMPADRKMMAAWGPFTFNPGDSQFVYYKIAAGQGANNIASITTLKVLLNGPDSLVTDVPDNSGQQLPGSFHLSQNYPNPFNPSTVIEYTLPSAGHVTLSIHNVLGQRVATLVDTEQRAGSHSVTWDGTDASGNPSATGVYFYRLETGDFVDSKKMLLVK